ncbi:hypothetical protein [Massilia sp. NR 4-1]|uniref:hypothetical protein n=1 Tax=Massilia sp. NR 4-1 TaxID=1678028 RepID=UPI0035A6752A
MLSFTYNVGQRGAERVLYLVNDGDFKGASHSISKTIYMQVNAGRGSKMVIAHGLIGRLVSVAAFLETTG